MAEGTELKKKEQTKCNAIVETVMEQMEASKQREIKKWKEEIAIAKRELAEPSLSLKRQQYLEDRILFRETWIKEHKEKMQFFGLKRGRNIRSTLPGSSHLSASSDPPSYGDYAVSPSDESGKIREFSKEIKEPKQNESIDQPLHSP